MSLEKLQASSMVKLLSVARALSHAQANGTIGSEGGYGPAIGHEDDVVHGQEDVDDLLSSLGF